MKTLLSLIFICSITVLFSQPTKERRSLNLKISFKDQVNNLIFFNVKCANDTIYSKDGKYKMLSYRKKYFYYRNKISLDCFFEEEYNLDSINYIDYYKLILRDSTNYIQAWWTHTDSTKIAYQYFPSYNRLGTKYFVPNEDLIIKIFHKTNLMTIRFEMYKIREEDYGKNVNIEILFQKGTFRITDPFVPKLISIIDDDE